MDFRKTWQHLFRASQLALFLALISSPIVGAQSPPGPPPINAKAAELVDANSGQVLYTKNAQQELPMASVTKLMTLYIAVRAIERHQIRLHDMVPADEEAYRIGGSQIWLEPGERLSVDQMLKAVAVGSANDAAYALGTYISGSEAGFVQQMNETAKAALTLPQEVQAPVRVGQALGHLEIKSGRHVIRSVSIVAAKQVARTTIGALTWKYLWKLFT
ncbi:serine hydrolase [Sulfobacillus thermotolerans]|uniref:serine hydrolase n=1 Tax=Sulfobacillus thermotolerans TaxID=338644 RepID=UPI0033681DFA